MKIKIIKKPMGTLNPMPVMGPDAFGAFVREWSDYLIKNGGTGRIEIPNPKRFGIFDNEGLINGGYEIAKISGHCTNPFHIIGRDRYGYTAYFNIPSSTKESYDDYLNIKDIEKCNLSNIVFTDLAILTPDRIQNIQKFFDEQKIPMDPVKLLETTKEMIYERSALVHRGLFGGYSL